MTASTCPQCGAAFDCCPQPDQRCWCLDLPLLPAEMLGKGAAACYCPACLRARLSSVSLGERDGVGASHATAAGPHLSPPSEGEGAVTGLQAKLVSFLSSWERAGERAGVRAPRATAAGPHLSPPPEEGGVTTVGKVS